MPEIPKSRDSRGKPAGPQVGAATGTVAGPARPANGSTRGTPLRSGRFFEIDSYPRFRGRLMRPIGRPDEIHPREGAAPSATTFTPASP